MLVWEGAGGSMTRHGCLTWAGREGAGAGTPGRRSRGSFGPGTARIKLARREPRQEEAHPCID